MLSLSSRTTLLITPWTLCHDRAMRCPPHLLAGAARVPARPSSHERVTVDGRLGARPHAKQQQGQHCSGGVVHGSQNGRHRFKMTKHDQPFVCWEMLPHRTTLMRPSWQYFTVKFLSVCLQNLKTFRHLPNPSTARGALPMQLHHAAATACAMRIWRARCTHGALYARMHALVQTLMRLQNASLCKAPKSVCCARLTV